MRRRQSDCDMVDAVWQRMWNLDARMAAMIRIDALWQASAPMDMCAGIDTTLARVLAVFGAAHPHCNQPAVRATHWSILLLYSCNLDFAGSKSAAN